MIITRNEDKASVIAYWEPVQGAVEYKIMLSDNGYNFTLAFYTYKNYFKYDNLNQYKLYTFKVIAIDSNNGETLIGEEQI